MQPRWLWLVFCSENHAKQTLPDLKDTRKLETSVLVYIKRKVLWSHIKKWAENEQGLFANTHCFLISGQNCLKTWIFFLVFPLLTLEDVMWLRDTVLGKETLLKIPFQIQSPKHIPCTLSPTDLSGTSAQELAHLTALNVINAIALKTSRVKMQYCTSECSGLRSSVWTDNSCKLRDARICGCNLGRCPRPIESKDFYQL